MGNNLEIDIERKASLLKKGIKDLQSMIGKVYMSAQQSNNNKLIFIKRSVDKLREVSRYLDGVTLPEIKETKKSTFIKDIEELHNKTLSNLSKMQELFKKQEAAEKKDSRYEGRFHADQRNLDNLRLAHSNIRQISFGLNMSRQDWKEIDNK